MKTLIIEDLPVNAELDRRAMAAVRGGAGFGLSLPYLDASSFGLSSTLAQFTQQQQNTTVNTGVNMAFAQYVQAEVKPVQNATNQSVINLGGVNPVV